MSNDLVKPGDDQLKDQLPDFMRDDVNDFMPESSDITIPRIKLAQSLTPEVKEGALSEGDIFLNVGGEVLAHKGEKLYFVPVFSGKEYILWADRKSGGGIVNRALPVRVNGVTRYKWTNPGYVHEDKIGGKTKVRYECKTYIDEDGLGEMNTQIPGQEGPPAAQPHFNIAVIIPSLENAIAAFSLIKTQVKRAKELNTMLTMGSLPMYARLFSAESVTETAGDQTYANYRFKQVRRLNAEERATYEIAKAWHEKLKSQSFVVDQGQAAEVVVEDDKF